MDPDSGQIGIGADTPSPAITQNDLSEESSELLDKIMAQYDILRGKL